MKKTIFMFLALFSICAGFAFADSKDTDPFDELVSKLLKDCPQEDMSIAVKVFNADLSNAERKKISKSVQFSFYCFEGIEVVADAEDADYLCTGKIETDGPNYILTAKIVDNYDDTVIAKAKQKVPKNYYADPDDKNEIRTKTVIVEKETDADDILGAVIVGTVIGGVFHALATPPAHHYRNPRPATRKRANPPKARPPKPARPNRP